LDKKNIYESRLRGKKIKRYFGDYPVHIGGCLWMMVEKCGTNSASTR